MNYNQDIILSTDNWNKNHKGWSCPILSAPDVELVKLVSNGRAINTDDYNYEDSSTIIKWLDSNPPPYPIIAVIKYKPKDEILKQKNTELSKHWKMFGILAPILKEHLNRIIIFISSSIVLGIGSLIIIPKNCNKNTKQANNNPSEYILDSKSGNQFKDTETIEWLDGTRVTKRNANFDKYNNDVPIAFADTWREWDSCNRKGIGCYCYPYNNYDSALKYGYLYNSYAVMDNKNGGVIPQNWRLIKISDIEKITKRWPNRGGYILKSKDGWHSKTGNAFGIDSLGFNALSGGWCSPDFKFPKSNVETHWWTSDSGPFFYNDYQTYYSWYLSTENNSMHWSNYQRQFGFYVRCIKE